MLEKIIQAGFSVDVKYAWGKELRALYPYWEWFYVWIYDKPVTDEEVNKIIHQATELENSINLYCFW